MKVGRNATCQCGSGRKYKHCCLSKSGSMVPETTRIIHALPDDNLNLEDASVEQSIPVLQTGEIFHPVRLYYQLYDKGTVKKCFQQLRCMEFDQSYDRWVWLYKDESRKLPLPAGFKKYRGQAEPFVLGSFFSDTDTEMFLDVRSIERAQVAASFFAEHVDRSLAGITHVGITNRLASEKDTGGFRIRFDHIFDNDKMVIDDGNGKLLNLIENKLENQPVESRINTLLSCVKSSMQETFPDVEKIPQHFNEDGIEAGLIQLKIQLITSQTAALERLKGNENVTKNEIFNKLFGGTYGEL